MIRKLLAVVALALAVPSLAFAQAGGNSGNAVGVWGQDTGTGLPCIVAPAGGSATCVLPTTAGGGGGGGGAVTLVNGADVTQGNTADAACTTDAGTCTVNAVLKRLAGRLTTINTTLGTPLQAGGTVVAIGPTAVGSNAANPPQLMAGTTNGSGTGAVRVLCADAVGTYCTPKASTSERVITKTNLTLNTSTTICPTAASPVTTEIYFTTAGVGISLNGGTLTTATVGTTANTTPDLAFATAGTLYTLPVPPTNIVTAYGAAGIVVCIQTTRP